MGNIHALKALAKKIVYGTLDLLPLPAAITAEFFRYHRYLPKISAPRSFSEFVQHRKLYEHDARFPTYADKVAVKDIVAQALGSEWVIPTIWHGKSLPDRPDWPIPYVLKANHASGWNYFVRQAGDIDWDEMRRQTAKWLETPWHPRLGESYYNQIDRQLLVEPILGDPTKSLPDYKFFVFGGRALYVQVDTDRMTDSEHKRSFYDRDWVLQPFYLKYPIDRRPHPRPAHFDAMLSAVEKVAAPFPFARVDLYDLPSGPKFGEITFCPGAGYERFTPVEMDFTLGKLWNDARGRTAAVPSGARA